LKHYQETDYLKTKQRVGEVYLWYAKRNEDMRRIRYPEFFNLKKRDLVKKEDQEPPVVVKKPTMAQLDEEVFKAERHLRKTLAKGK
jgi:hypothetical protein